jgi:hypothetical protein
MNRVAVVLLVWQRIPALHDTLQKLINQTEKDFTVFISNGNLERSEEIEKYANLYRKRGLRIELSHDGNEIFAFRRFTVGKKIAELGYEIVLFLDDDITFPENYIQNCLSQYEPKSYKSGFAWNFQRGGENYYKYRTRVYNNEQRIHYCGTGISMVDATVFLEEGLIKDAPPGAIKIEDLWLSYYVDHVLKWKLLYMATPGIKIGGSDNVALYKDLLESKYNKASFLKDLVRMGWKLR